MKCIVSGYWKILFVSSRSLIFVWICCVFIKSPIYTPSWRCVCVTKMTVVQNSWSLDCRGTLLFCVTSRAHRCPKTFYSPLSVFPEELNNKGVVVFTVKWPSRTWHTCSSFRYILYYIGLGHRERDPCTIWGAAADELRSCWRTVTILVLLTNLSL